MHIYSLLLLVSVISLHKGNPIIYNVIPDDDDRGVNSFSLQHYIDNAIVYILYRTINFNSHQVSTMYLNDDLIFKDISNFSLIESGINQCISICTAPASVVLINVSAVKFLNINLINCIKHHKDYVNETYYNPPYISNSVRFGKITDCHTSVFIFNSSVTICNMEIIATVMTSFTAIIENAQDGSKIIKFNSVP